MTMPFIDLKAQFRDLEGEIRKRIDVVLAHGRYIMGPEIQELEENLARFTGVKHVVGCSSGTDALLMPLMALGVGVGDAIFTTPFTFVATAEVISLLGATPVFVDIDPDTFNMVPGNLRTAVAQVKENGKLTPRGIIPVDLFGLPADYDPIMALAEEEGLFVLEDAAQSMGGVYKGRQACALGHMAGTSFFPAKPLGAYGDAGAVFTNDVTQAATLRSIRVHGEGSDKYDNVRLGINGRLDSIQAAVLLCKLSIFPKELERRRKVADWYSQKLADLVITPKVPHGYRSAWAQYSVLTERRDAVTKALKEAGIPTAVYYPRPLHLQTAYKYLGYREGDFPVSESAARRIFSLPMHPYLEEAQVDKIVSVIAAALKV